MRHFTHNELKRLNSALSAYIYNKSNELSHQDCGDAQWTELNEYKKLNDTIIDEMLKSSS